MHLHLTRRAPMLWSSYRNREVDQGQQALGSGNLKVL